MTEHSDKYCGWCDGCTAEESRLKAKNERYREALERISKGYASYDGGNRFCGWCEFYSGAHDQECAVTLAQAALSATPLTREEEPKEHESVIEKIAGPSPRCHCDRCHTERRLDSREDEG